MSPHKLFDNEFIFYLKTIKNFLNIFKNLTLNVIIKNVFLLKFCNKYLLFKFNSNATIKFLRHLNRFNNYRYEH